MSTGFTGMLFDLLLIFTFQTLYGYVFHQVGILITAFMFGTAAVSLLVTVFLERISRDIRLFIKIELGIILFTCLPPVFSYCQAITLSIQRRMSPASWVYELILGRIFEALEHD